MTDKVRYDVAGGVATIFMDNPPLNALGAELRAGLAEAFARAEADAAVSAIILTAVGKSWPVGADIREFGKPPQQPVLPDLCNQIAAIGKPVIAAIHGSALGGGLELALVCAVRIAHAKAQFGFPEVLLGILPGAGGTQRLAPLIGAEAALRMMISGNSMPADSAARLGLVDHLADGEPLALATEMARAHADGRHMLSTAASRHGAHRRDPAGWLHAVDAERAKARPVHDLAPSRIIDCVEAALLLPPEQGLTFERAAFEDLIVTPQARALRHVFLSERSAAKTLIAGDRMDLQHVAILGGGWIGAGLAYELLAHGVTVTLIETDRPALANALARVARQQEAAVAKGSLTETQRQADWARLTPAMSPDAAVSADLVIEAVTESLMAKTAALTALSAARKGRGPVLSVTCGLDPQALAAAFGAQGELMSLFVSDPVRRVTLAELAAPDVVAPAVAGAAQALARLLGWRLIRHGPKPGFLAMRMLTSLFDLADRCVTSGASPFEVDRALRAYGLTNGPYSMKDIYGPDHALLRHADRRREVTADPVGQAAAIWLIAEGRRGRRTGAGYHLYPAGARAGAADPALGRVLDGMRTPATLEAAHIQARLVAGLGNEGAWAIDEGRAHQPSDIDLVAMAQGFPRWRGGPMQAADEAGLLTVRNQLHDWAAGGDPYWQPAPLWDELIRNGQRFGDLNRR